MYYRAKIYLVFSTFRVIMWRRTVWLCLVFRDHYFVRFFRALFTLKNFFKRMYVKNTKFRKIIRRVRAKLFKRRKWLFFKR